MGMITLIKEAKSQTDNYMKAVMGKLCGIHKLANQVKNHAEFLKICQTIRTILFDGILDLYNLTSEESNDDDFFLLHGVTSCNALGNILIYLTPNQIFEACYFYLRAIILTYVVRGCLEFNIEYIDIDYTKYYKILDWKEIFEALFKIINEEEKAK